ncbi:MAG: prenyltransferase [Gammaproteobacteria bacterium]|nr:prenyltransferase [Gammaproteobacteria bacterium]
MAKRLLLATRPKFFSASILPMLLGTAWGHHVSGQFDITALTLALAATLCVHAGANVINDVFDELGGSDRSNNNRIYPYTGGSRFIQNGIMSVSAMTRWALMLYFVAIVVGAILTGMKGVGVLLFGLVGVGLGALYSIPPIQLSARGIGEATVAVAFGVVPVTGAAWLQSGIVDGEVLLVSIPVSLWVAAIILINEVPDIAADAAAGKRTLAVRLGLRGTQALYVCIHILAVLAIGLAVSQGTFSVIVLVLPALLLLAAILASRSIGRATNPVQPLKRSIELTLAIHALGTLWLAGYVWYTS